jgi:hypothetical protein
MQKYKRMYENDEYCFDVFRKKMSGRGYHFMLIDEITPNMCCEWCRAGVRKRYGRRCWKRYRKHQWRS